MPRKIDIDPKEVIRLYEKFGTMNRVALSLGCCAKTVKQILLENNIPLKKYTPKRFYVDFSRRNRGTWK